MWRDAEGPSQRAHRRGPIHVAVVLRGPHYVRSWATMLPAVARLTMRALVFHAITTPDDAPHVLNVTRAYGVVRLYQEIARYNALVEEHILQLGFRSSHYTQRPGFYAALIRLVLPLIVTDRSVDTLIGLDADMEVGVDLGELAEWSTPRGLLRLACGTSAAHVARVKLWCRDTPRNCHPESYCFGGVVRPPRRRIAKRVLACYSPRCSPAARPLTVALAR